MIWQDFGYRGETGRRTLRTAEGLPCACFRAPESRNRQPSRFRRRVCSRIFAAPEQGCRF